MLPGEDSAPRFHALPPEHRFTFCYSQPEDYHFCLDSILLPRFVAGQMRPANPSSEFQALDLCAGCGVVGFELAHHLPWIAHFDFLEIQSSYETHFRRNLEITQNASRNFRFINASYDLLLGEDYANRYDLIVANPPYFRPGEGVAPRSEIKFRSRFFADGSPETLIRGIAHALKKGGRAYVLVRNGAQHGRNNARELASHLPPSATWRVAAVVRGTHVVEISQS